ncbi:SIR2 family protein [Mucilaginibacter dorajii]|nr:SIR2 family protein [Mucilaginibacter dorajii]MCS3732358.1 hypothetical protein [Mucilaginibacter dorajii]
MLTDAGIPYGPITLDNVSQDEAWLNTVEYLYAHELVEQFLNVFIEVNDGVEDLVKLREEIERASIDKMFPLLKSILRERADCVLFLGPEFLNWRVQREIYSFNRYFNLKLMQKLKDLDIDYEEIHKDDLSYMIHRFETKRKFVAGDTEQLAHTIYKSPGMIRDYYRHLPGFKLPLIINTNPDTVLSDEYPDQCELATYDITNIAPTPFPGLNEQKTLVYNIFGSFQNPPSILFTEKKAVEFTRNVYDPETSIPFQIKDLVRSSYCIFIGFNFNDWHFKILFDVLDLQKQPQNFAFYDINTQVKEQQIEYYERHYHMSFIKNDVEAMLEEILAI